MKEARNGDGMITGKDKIKMSGELLINIGKNLEALTELLEKCSSMWDYEDMVYRFYHHSFKVYRIQELTEEMARLFKSLLPGQELNKGYLEIIKVGTGITYSIEHNKNWAKITRPILEAYFHSRYFLEMMVKYGRELQSPPEVLPSGWAAVLYLYNIR